jgi:hypothetical protein
MVPIDEFESKGSMVADDAVPEWWFVGPSVSGRPSSQEGVKMSFDLQALDGPPSCAVDGGVWSGMHCLHAISQFEAMCCGPCGQTMSNPTATSVATFQYRLGATHTEPGPHWPEVRAAMPKIDWATV